MIKYKLFNNKGILITRQPTISEGELLLEFEGSPEGATAIVKHEGTTLYRKLEKGQCVIPTFVGETSVSVTVLDGKTKNPVYTCEGLKGERLGEKVLVMPNDMNMPDRVVEMQLEVQALREENRDMKQKITELEERLNGILEGYDIL